MNIWIAVPGLLLTFYLLKLVSDQLENSFSALAFRFKIPATIAGATLLAIGGSAPELFTALNSAIFYKTFEIGLITIIWSAIFNLFLITGLVGARAKEPISLSKRGMIRDMIFYALSAFALTLTIFDGKITQFESFCLIAVYGFYLFVLHRGRKEITKLEQVEENNQALYKSVIISFLGLAGIGFLSWAMIEFGLEIANFAGFSVAVVSVVFFAFGTSIPDTFIAIAAAKKGNGSGAIASVFGSNTFDILIGLGVPIALVGGVPMDVDGIFDSLVMLFLSIFIAIIFIAKDWKISRHEGYAMISIFFIFLGYFLFW